MRKSFFNFVMFLSIVSQPLAVQATLTDQEEENLSLHKILPNQNLVKQINSCPQEVEFSIALYWDLNDFLSLRGVSHGWKAFADNNYLIAHFGWAMPQDKDEKGRPTFFGMLREAHGAARSLGIDVTDFYEDSSQPSKKRRFSPYAQRAVYHFLGAFLLDQNRPLPRVIQSLKGLRGLLKEQKYLGRWRLGLDRIPPNINSLKEESLSKWLDEIKNHEGLKQKNDQATAKQVLKILRKCGKKFENLEEALSWGLPSQDEEYRYWSYHYILRRDGKNLSSLDEKSFSEKKYQGAVLCAKALKIHPSKKEGLLEQAGELGVKRAWRELGYIYGRQKKYQESLECFKKILEKKAAHWYIGLIYLNGSGVDKDFKRAYDHFCLASLIPEALYNLGGLFSTGDAGEKNYQKSFSYHKQAAEKGYTDSQNLVGGFYSSGRGVKEDPKQAFLWWKRAAEKGHVDSQYQVGQCYLLGEGIEKDETQAFLWWKRSAEKGHNEAAFECAFDYLRRAKVPSNHPQLSLRNFHLCKAKKWFWKGMEGISNKDKSPIVRFSEHTPWPREQPREIRISFSALSLAF